MLIIYIYIISTPVEPVINNFILSQEHFIKNSITLGVLEEFIPLLTYLLTYLRFVK